jgi:sugar porter (SP) family MFS transporter
MENGESTRLQSLLSLVTRHRLTPGPQGHVIRRACVPVSPLASCLLSELPQLFDLLSSSPLDKSRVITNKMPGGPAVPAGSHDVSRVEAPVTLKTYLMCAFAAFGGIFFGYDSGYISGVMAMAPFYHVIEGDSATALSASNKSLITSILSVGTFFGAIIAGDLADWFGRRNTVIAGSAVFLVGVALQIATGNPGGLPLIVIGRLIAGFGVGFVSAILILYMSEIAPKKVRGAIVAGYQFCVTIGLMLASCVAYSTQERPDSGSYRIPIAIQALWAIILGGGLIFLPESPRFFVRKGALDKAASALAHLRSQPVESDFIKDELSEIIANHEYELSVIPQGGYFDSWFNCFRGGLRKPSSNLRRVILGTSLQMMQQWTG